MSSGSQPELHVTQGRHGPSVGVTQNLLFGIRKKSGYMSMDFTHSQIFQQKNSKISQKTHKTLEDDMKILLFPPPVLTFSNFVVATTKKFLNNVILLILFFKLNYIFF